MKRTVILLSVSGLMLALLVVAGVYAQGPTASSPPGLEGSIQASDDTINFQGRLYTSSGAPVPAGNYNMRFTVCSDSSCSSTVWGPTEFTAAVDSQGLFNVLLTSFNANHFTGNRWLRIEVCNTANQNPCTSGWDTMTPYQPMTSVAIAIGNIRKNMVDTSTATSTGYILTITNSGSGGALYGVSSSAAGLRGDGWYGLYGYSGNGGYGVYGTGTSGVWGVEGHSPDSYGVLGVCDGNSYGVYGYSAGTAGAGVVGYNSANIGVYGESTSGVGVQGYASSTTADVDGVFGYAATVSPYRAPDGVSTGATGSVATAGDYGVFGLNTAAANGYGVVGSAFGNNIYLPPDGYGAGVLGSMNSASGFVVFGRNNSATGGSGVYGMAGTTAWAAPAAPVGVAGKAGTTSGIGVWGYNDTTTAGTGVRGEGFTGVVGYSAYARGVFGQTDYTNYTLGQAVVGYASATGVPVHGVYGVAGTTIWSVPSSGPAGVAGYVNSASGIGVWGGNGATTGGYGVYGSGYYGVYGASSYYAGVVGNSSYSSGYGVFGLSSGTAGAGVYGRETASGYPNTYGVAGHHYWGGVGVGAWSYTGNIFEGYAGDYPDTSNRRLHLTNAGALYVDVGYYTPSALGGVEGQVLAAMMVTENLAEDFGTARLVNGRATVQIARDFAAVVNLSTDYYIFLTPRGECNGLYVASAGPTSFEVRELGGGKSNIAFDYRIVAKRLGYEGLRMQPPPEPAPQEKSTFPQEEPVVTATAISVGVEGSATTQTLPAQSAQALPARVAPAVVVPAEPKR